MNDISGGHEPTPEFHARLKSDIARAYRSDQLFGGAAATGRTRAPSRRVALIFGIAAGVMLTLVTGMVLGASASYAAAATPSAPRSPFAILPIVNALACSPAKAAPRATQPAQAAVPVVDLSPPTAKTTETLGAVLGLKEAPDGRVLVNDALRRQMRLFDPSLATSTIVLDSTPGSARSYGGIPTPLIPFVGDSSLFFDDRARNQMLVLDGFGQVGRALALVSRPPGRTTFVDAKGRMLYKVIGIGNRGREVVPVPISGLMPRTPRPDGRAGSISGRGGGGDPSMRSIRITDRPDSLPILRDDFEARRTDTAGYVTQPPDDRDVLGPDGGGKTVLVYGKNGEVTSVKQVINPLYAIDEWAVLSDGTIAFVRGHDYHVDWIHPDGSKSSSPKLPYDWKQLTQADKQRLVDSTRKELDSLAALARANDSAAANRTGGTPGGRCGSDCNRITAADNMQRYLGVSSLAVPPRFREFPYEIVPLSQISDYYPPISAGAAIPDRDGNLWILPRTTTLSKKGELVYDVVNPKDGLVRRVRLPLGRSIAGFGKGGVVYLQAGDMKNGFTLERTMIPAKPAPK